MASEDSFITEVTEEVRRDRLFALFRRYGWIAIAVVVAIVVGAAWNEWRKAEARALAEARGDAILTALEAESAELRAASLAKLAEGGEGQVVVPPVVALLAAAERAAAEDSPTAVSLLEKLASTPGLDPLYQDLAQLKAVIIGSKEIPPEERVSRLEALILPGSPFRTLALEQTALAHAEAGNADAALKILSELISDADSSQGLRRRAQQLIVALGGSLDAT